jgi:hypothetical protein
MTDNNQNTEVQPIDQMAQNETAAGTQANGQ